MTKFAIFDGDEVEYQEATTPYVAVILAYKKQNSNCFIRVLGDNEFEILHALSDAPVFRPFVYTVSVFRVEYETQKGEKN